MIEFKDLSAGYDRTERLHHVNACARRGRLTAVIGPNGSGKSTLLKCASGLLKPLSGEVLLNSRPLSLLSEKERARAVSYMPQSRITPEISVRQLVAHGRYPHLKWGQALSETDRSIIRDAMRHTDTEFCADRPVSSLSGGERQRAYLAMMLAQQTPVMLLDEPTTYLDLSSQYSLMALLQTLSRQDDRCIVAVLHDLSIALEYADDIFLMKEGCLAASGTPDEIHASGMLRTVFSINVRRLADGGYWFGPQTEGVSI